MLISLCSTHCGGGGSGLSEKLHCRLSKPRFAISDFDLLWRREEREMRAGPAVQPAQAVITVRSLTYYYRPDARVVWCGVVWSGMG